MGVTGDLFPPMSGFPWMQFFPGDWIADTRLLTLATKGAWIDVLAALHNSPTRGQLTLEVEAWARLISATPQDAAVAIRELASTAVADVTTLPDSRVTICCRRMAREEAARNSHAKRQERYRSRREPSVTQASRGDASLQKSDGESDADKFSLQSDLQNSDASETEKCRGRSQKLEARSHIIHAAEAEKQAPKIERKRNDLLDSLAAIETPNLAEVTNWGKHAKALQLIRSVSADVTADEIRRRAHNYSRQHPDWPLTSTALANHWGACRSATNGSPPPTNGSIYTEPAGWREKYARMWPQLPVPPQWADVTTACKNDLVTR